MRSRRVLRRGDGYSQPCAPRNGGRSENKKLLRVYVGFAEEMVSKLCRWGEVRHSGQLLPTAAAWLGCLAAKAGHDQMYAQH
jgi:hypothetical protein